jgi:histidinol phosphatase-like PHP family hydrolase
MKLIDFHTHTFFSAGELSPAEHIRRAAVAGYHAIGLTDHVDYSNYEHVFESVKKMTDMVPKSGWDIIAVPGVEFTHVPAALIGDLTQKARDFGIKLIIVHGETIAEPVEKGTNRAAIEAGVTILAHPGLITEEDARLAAEKGVYLEITSKKGHSLTNGHVYKMAKKVGAKMVLDSDSHSDSDFLSPEYARAVLAGCGMNEEDIEEVFANNCKLLEILTGK